MNARSASIALADLVALHDVAAPAPTSRRGRARACRCGASRSRRAARSRPRGRSSGDEDPGADRVVDVVVDVRDAVDDADDLPLERLRLVGAGVLEDPVAHLPGQVQPAAVALEQLDDAQRVLVVAEAAGRRARAALVERLLAGVAERRVAEVVAERRSPRRDPRSAAARARRRARSRRPRACASAACGSGRPRGRRTPASCAAAGGTPSSGRSGRGRAGTACAAGTPPRRASRPRRLVRADGERRQPALLVLAHAACEGVGNSPASSGISPA